MRFSDQLEALAKRVRDLENAASAAASESHDKVEQRIDQAKATTGQALESAQMKGEAAGSRAQDSWSKLKADAAARHARIQGAIDKRGREMDAKGAEADAKWAEDDADAALDYASWAIEDAKYAVLNAIDARANADNRAARAKA